MKKTLLPVKLCSMVLLVVFLLGCTGAPVTSTIIYHLLPRGPAGLWEMSPDGSDVTQVTTTGWFGRYSPDNSKIAYSEFYANGVWVVNADGTDPVQLNDFGSCPAWSPDGKRLVFHVGGTVGNERYLWIMNSDGTDAHQLSMVNASFADWSPDGEVILFHGEVNNGIWQIAPDGSGEKLLYKSGGYPAWSPDGKEIAYVDLSGWNVWIMNADGSGGRKLTADGGMHPVWSPDGSQIAYTGTCEDDDGNKKECIWVIDVDGTDAHAINEEGRSPDWSN